MKFFLHRWTFSAMKFQIITACAFLAAMSICSSSAASLAVTNATMMNTTDPKSNETTIPIIVLVQKDNNMRMEKDSDTDYAARDLKWLVVRKITNISKVEEISTDEETGKTKRVLVEDRAEEFRVFKDDQHRQVLSERDFKSIPFPLSFL